MSESTTPQQPTAVGGCDHSPGGSAHPATDRAAAERVAQLMPRGGR